MATLATMRAAIRTKLDEPTTNVLTDAEIEDAVKDVIRIWRKHVYRQAYNSALSTAANSRTVDVSAISPAVKQVNVIQLVVNATTGDARETPFERLWDGKIYFPSAFTKVYPLNIFYLGAHTIPTSNSETLTISDEDELTVMHGAMAELLYKAARRPTLAESATEVRAIAQVYQTKFDRGLAEAKNAFSSTRS